MRSLPRFPGAHAPLFVLSLSALTLAGGWATLRAGDRFVVPSSPSETSSAPSPAPSGGGGGSSSSSSSSDYTPSPSSGNDRFVVPTPSPSSTGGNRNAGGGYYTGGHRSHGGYYDDSPFPYWGGCYYWNGDYYYWGGYRYRTRYDSFDRYSYLGYSRQLDRPTIAEQPAIFFPPAPPPLGAPIPPRDTRLARVSAPALLADFLYEPFYSPLSTRLRDQDLSKKMLLRIEAYRTKRAALRAELLKTLDAAKEVPEQDRTRFIEKFAFSQTPRIVALESEAEELRSDLLRGGLMGVFSGTGNWNDSRTWVLGRDDLHKSNGIALMYQFLVMRAAVFYQEGLSPAQRLLLREVAMELQVEAFKPEDSKQKTESEEPLLFFSPDTARIRIPDDLPAALAAKVEAYRTEKHNLKRTLCAMLYAQDMATPMRREKALRKLAEEQAPRISVLEALAEDIRAGFAALPAPPGPANGPGFSPELVARITAYRKEKHELQQLLQAELEDIRKRFAPEAERLSPKSTDLANAAYKLEGGTRISHENMMKMREAIAQLNNRNALRFEALNKERESIRSEVAKFAAANQRDNSEQSVTTLIRSFVTSLRDEEAGLPYLHYRTAVYQPGLSPEQRRLLFGVALEKLALPLPDGEF